MKYIKFGNTGLTVSKLCLGCMTYGEAKGDHDWTLDEAASRPLIRQALEVGINFFDTANVYSAGSSEAIIGRALRDFARRDEIVIATKAYGPWKLAPNTMGLSRKSLMHAVDDSLRRLGTDYIDLYQIHRFDPDTPIEETLDALDAIVKSGKVRYIGASSMFAWQFLKMLNTSETRSWSKFVSMQNYYNLLYREEEREMFPLCKDQKIATMPWSPLARGKLTRDWDADDSARSQSDRLIPLLYSKTEDADRQVVEAVSLVAANRGVSRAQVALAWILSKDHVTTPIVGASKASHLEDAIAALDLELTGEEITRLEAPYIPHEIAGMLSFPKFDLSLTKPDEIAGGG
jgi:aryl-alcohol dehydrogenase-like predicted oxidoreductase